MGILQKLFGKKKPAGIDKRKTERKRLKEFFKIQITIDGKKFRISDFSSAGIGLIDEGTLQLDVGKTYIADLVAYGQTKCSVKLRVIRKSGRIFGCEIIDKDTFRVFEEDYLSKADKA